MAVDVSTNVWKASVTDGPFPITLSSHRVRLAHIEFTDYADDADSFSITDVAGHVIWEGNGAVDLQPVRSGKVGWAHGIIVASLTNGTLLFYTT